MLNRSLVNKEIGQFNQGHCRVTLENLTQKNTKMKISWHHPCGPILIRLSIYEMSCL